ncbi:hypothetical protein DSLASN_09170 [Desulfoluna limicola]|uniref:Uncharacterized protein n=1 Tax=Desulfoluna limicola TaxID=2810562 RepID=A0ABM7PDP0_9BACT|nr:hypothetical protein [Desulfoluna limicola]BCS95285.1 hypothetical protein DSLASN_09170 [Desulfoluna limicola]
MKITRWFRAAALLTLLSLTGCGGNGATEDANIQKNEPSGFTLMDVFKGEGALEEAWDAIDGSLVNEKFSKTVNANPAQFVTFSQATHALLTASPTLLPELLGMDVKELLSCLTASAPSTKASPGVQAFHGEKTTAEQLQGLYALLDQLSDSPQHEGYANQMLHRIIGYVLGTKTPLEISEDMQELVDDINKPDFHNDFLDLTTLLGKLLIRSDYSMWKNADGDLLNAADIDPTVHANLNLGNIVEGVHALLNGFNEVMTDETARLAVHQTIRGLGSILDPQLNLDGMMRNLLCELEDRLTAGGAIYEGDPVYNENSAQVYSNAELSLVVREFAPYLLQYFLRADREMALISDSYGDKPYPLGVLGRNFDRMAWDMEGARIEESIYDLLRYDLWGRDRVSDPEAFHTSFLENLMFFASLGSHIGYLDGGETNEGLASSHPNYDHGHGEGAGTITVNDTLFAMKTHKTAGLGMYQIALQDDDWKYMFRARAPYTVSSTDADMAPYGFRYDQNYPIGLMVAGTPGDMGSPEGGKPKMVSDDEPALNGYRPYCPTGVEDDNIALNTMSASMRAAWHAEGPYYCTAKTGETVAFDGRSWEVTHTPGGRVYAWIHKPSEDPESWEYYYPSQYEGQAMEDQASLSVQYGPATHALFTSDVNLKGGVNNPLSIDSKLEIKLGPDHQRVIAFTDIRLYYRDEIVAMINDAFGETVCYPYDTNDGEYLQIVSPYGQVFLNNTYYNPLARFFKTDELIGSELTTAPNAFRISAENTAIEISVDNSPSVTVSFTTPSRTWTREMIMARLLDAGLNVLPFGSGFEILGTSGDPEVGGITATDISGSGVEELLGGSGSTLHRYVNRMERYRGSFRSDYYLGKLGGDFYTVAYDDQGNLAMPKVNEGDIAGSLVVNEIIGDSNPKRECATHEEALFRNYQFFFAERKFILVMPIHVTALGSEAAFIFQVMEANGYTGFMNGRKYLGNQVWAKKRDDGQSTLPGDYRMCIRVISKGLIGSIAVTQTSVYNETIDCGVAFNAVFPHNSAVIYRLGFPRAPMMTHGTDAEGNPVTDYLVGSQDFEVGDAIWQNRNATLVILQALWGALHSQTDVGYESTRGGMLSFFDMMTYLLKPLFYYQKGAEHLPKEDRNWPTKCWKPRIIDGHNFLLSSAEFYGEGKPMETWYGSEEERGYYRPAKIPTLITILTDSDPYGEKSPDGTPARCDSLLAVLTEYDVNAGGPPRSRLLTGALTLVQRLGDKAFDDPAGAYAPDDLDLEKAHWGPRRKILYGLEQITSAVRMTKAEGTALNETKNTPTLFPAWLFAQGPLDAPTHMREEDLLLDWGIDLLVGEDAREGKEGRGLANYPDERPTDADWQDLTDTVDMLSAILHDSSPYNVTELLLSFLDAVMARPEPYNREDLAGALYGLGRLFAQYDNEKGRWVHQGEEGFDPLYRILKERVPAIHDAFKDDTGATYHATLVILNEFLKENGLVEALVDDVTIPSGWGTIIQDLTLFLGKETVTEHDPLWATLASLLKDLARAVDVARDITKLREVYDRYGIQVND